MGWTLDDYLNQPPWFVNEIVKQINKERNDSERQNRIK